MHRIVAGLIVAGLATGSLFAQGGSSFAQEEAPQSDPLADISDILSTEEGQQQEEALPARPVSELDRLSRSGDDPFAGVIAAQRREPVSVTLRALNKITARFIDIEAPMNEIVHFGSLELLPRSCDKRPPEEFPETTVFLEVFDIELTNRVSNLRPQAQEQIEGDIEVAEITPLDVAPVAVTPDQDAITGSAVLPAGIIEGPSARGVNIFRGWMFASSPALNALEHAVYDVWVIDCKTRIAGS